MIKRIIQFCSMLALAVTFTAVSANAQVETNDRIDAKVPFEFHIGQKAYPAGEYVMLITRSATNATSLSLQDKEGNQLENILVSQNGDVAKNDFQLVFSLKKDRHTLSKVLTNKQGFTLVTPNGKQDAAKKKNAGAEAKASVSLR